MRVLKTLAVSVGTTAVAAVSLPDVQAGTESLVVQNSPANSQNLFVVNGSAIAKANGLILIPGASISLDVSDGSSVFLISDSGTIDVRVAQLGRLVMTKKKLPKIVNPGEASIDASPKDDSISTRMSNSTSSPPRAGTTSPGIAFSGRMFRWSRPPRPGRGGRCYFSRL